MHSVVYGGCFKERDEDISFLADVDECIAAKHTCDANANCVNTHGSYNCSCKSGYTGDGFNCTGEIIQIFSYNYLVKIVLDGIVLRD